MIDVVIPAYNQFNLVVQCIDTMKAQRGVGKIIVVDDASTDRHLLDYFAIPFGYGLLRNRVNLGFLDSVNKGMEQVSTQYAAIVNSDAVPLSAGSLHNLVLAMEDMGANVAGAKLLFMPGSSYGKEYTIQHAGVAFDSDGVPYHPFMGLHRDTRAANKNRIVGAVTGAVMCVRVDVWRERGGFDAAFRPGGYEDVDFCLRAKRVIYVADSEWLHLMHGSSVNGDGVSHRHDDNLAVLLGRWGTKCDEEIYYGI